MFHNNNIPPNVVLHQTQDMKDTSNDSIILLIPVYILEKILVNLDAQTLFQCAFVCRYWNSVITSLDFISRNSNRTSLSGNNDEALLLKIFHRKESKRSFRRRLYYSLHHDNDRFDLFRTVESPHINLFTKKKLVGTSNGLVCLADNRFHKFIFWNPIVRSYALLPRIFSTSSSTVASVGFGFDCRNNDFKVVKFVEHDDDDLYTIWAFSYKTWSWKQITDSAPPFCSVEDQPHVLINGVLHWLAFHFDGHYDFILTFDLKNEVFGEILLPESLTRSIRSLSIVETGGSLAVLRKDLVASFVWVMKRYGVQESWTNIATFPNQSKNHVPRELSAICKNNDIMLKMDDGQILRYNPSTATKSFAGVTTKGVKEDGVLFRYYEESLYLLENREDVEYHRY